MALSLNQVKKRSQQTNAKSEQQVAPAKKRALSPWEDAVATSSKHDTPSIAHVEKPVELEKNVATSALEVIAPALEPVTTVEAQVLNEIIVPVKLETKVETPVNVKETAAIINVSEQVIPSKKASPKEPSKAIRIQKTDNEETSDESVSFGFSQLTGIQRKIVLFIFADCFHRASLESNPITVEHFSSSLGTAYHSIKKSVDRLQQKKLLERVSFKNGRGGWTQYKISRPVYQELMRLKQESSLPEITSNESGALRNVKLETNWRQVDQLKNSSNSEIVASSNLSPEWEQIEISSLSEFGFTKTHLKQIAQQQKLSPVEAQDSINFFAFDLSHNNKMKEIKGPPLNFFMGIVRRGTPYVPPANYISPEDEARIKYLAYLEGRDKQREEQETRIKALALKDWFHGLSESEKSKLKEIAPAHARERGPAQQLFIEDYFDKNIWPSLFSKFSMSPEIRTKISEEIRESLQGNA